MTKRVDLSLVDELQELERRISTRLAELEPLVIEYNELQRLAKRLGVKAPKVSAASAPGRSGASRAPAPAPRVARADQVLHCVKERPGTTVQEIAAQLGLDPTGLYRVVRALERDHKLVKDGRSLRPVDPVPER